MAVCGKCGAQMADGVQTCPTCGAPQGAVQQAGGDDVQSNKVMAVLAYLGILVLVPILAAKESPFARYHANQGLILLIVNIGLGIIALIPFVGIVAGIATFATLVFAIMGIINAAKGEMKPLPLIGNLFTLIK